MPTCSSPGRTITRPSTSAASSSTAPGQPRGRQQPPVVRAGVQPCQVRHHQSDEGDRPAAATATPASRVTAASPVNRVSRCSARAPGYVLAERQQVQPGALATASTSPASRNGLIWVVIPVSRPTSEPTSQNRTHPGSRCRKHDCRAQRVEQVGERDAGQCQGDRCGPTPPSERAGHHHVGHQRPGEREPHIAVQAGDAEREDPHHDEEAGARADPENPGSANGLRVWPA